MNPIRYGKLYSLAYGGKSSAMKAVMATSAYSLTIISILFADAVDQMTEAGKP